MATYNSLEELVKAKKQIYGNRVGDYFTSEESYNKLKTQGISLRQVHDALGDTTPIPKLPELDKHKTAYTKWFEAPGDKDYNNKLAIQGVIQAVKDGRIPHADIPYYLRMRRMPAYARKIILEQVPLQPLEDASFGTNFSEELRKGGHADAYEQGARRKGRSWTTGFVQRTEGGFADIAGGIYGSLYDLKEEKETIRQGYQRDIAQFKKGDNWMQTNIIQSQPEVIAAKKKGLVGEAYQTVIINLVRKKPTLLIKAISADADRASKVTNYYQRKQNELNTKGSKEAGVFAAMSIFPELFPAMVAKETVLATKQKAVKAYTESGGDLWETAKAIAKAPFQEVISRPAEFLLVGLGLTHGKGTGLRGKLENVKGNLRDAVTGEVLTKRLKQAFPNIKQQEIDGAWTSAREVQERALYEYERAVKLRNARLGISDEKPIYRMSRGRAVLVNPTTGEVVKETQPVETAAQALVNFRDAATRQPIEEPTTTNLAADLGMVPESLNPTATTEPTISKPIELQRAQEGQLSHAELSIIADKYSKRIDNALDVHNEADYNAAKKGHLIASVALKTYEKSIFDNSPEVQRLQAEFTKTKNEIMQGRKYSQLSVDEKANLNSASDILRSAKEKAIAEHEAIGTVVSPEIPTPPSPTTPIAEATTAVETPKAGKGTKTKPTQKPAPVKTTETTPAPTKKSQVTTIPEEEINLHQLPAGHLRIKTNDLAAEITSAEREQTITTLNELDAGNKVNRTWTAVEKDGLLEYQGRAADIVSETKPTAKPAPPPKAQTPAPVTETKPLVENKAKPTTGFTPEIKLDGIEVMSKRTRKGHSIWVTLNEKTGKLDRVDPKGKVKTNLDGSPYVSSKKPAVEKKPVVEKTESKPTPTTTQPSTPAPTTAYETMTLKEFQAGKALPKGRVVITTEHPVEKFSTQSVVDTIDAFNKKFPTHTWKMVPKLKAGTEISEVTFAGTPKVSASIPALVEKPSAKPSATPPASKPSAETPGDMTTVKVDAKVETSVEKPKSNKEPTHSIVDEAWVKAREEWIAENPRPNFVESGNATAYKKNTAEWDVKFKKFIDDYVETNKAKIEANNPKPPIKEAPKIEDISIDDVLNDWDNLEPYNPKKRNSRSPKKEGGFADFSFGKSKTTPVKVTPEIQANLIKVIENQLTEIIDPLRIREKLRAEYADLHTVMKEVDGKPISLVDFHFNKVLANELLKEVVPRLQNGALIGELTREYGNKYKWLPPKTLTEVMKKAEELVHPEGQTNIGYSTSDASTATDAIKAQQVAEESNKRVLKRESRNKPKNAALQRAIKEAEQGLEPDVKDASYLDTEPNSPGAKQARMARLLYERVFQSEDFVSFDNLKSQMNSARRAQDTELSNQLKAELEFQTNRFNEWKVKDTNKTQIVDAAAQMEARYDEFVHIRGRAPSSAQWRDLIREPDYVVTQTWPTNKGFDIRRLDAAVGDYADILNSPAVRTTHYPIDMSQLADVVKDLLPTPQEYLSETALNKVKGIVKNRSTRDWDYSTFNEVQGYIEKVRNSLLDLKKSHDATFGALTDKANIGNKVELSNELTRIEDKIHTAMAVHDYILTQLPKLFNDRGALLDFIKKGDVNEGSFVRMTWETFREKGYIESNAKPDIPRNYGALTKEEIIKIADTNGYTFTSPQALENYIEIYGKPEGINGLQKYSNRQWLDYKLNDSVFKARSINGDYGIKFDPANVKRPKFTGARADNAGFGPLTPKEITVIAAKNGYTLSSEALQRLSERYGKPESGSAVNLHSNRYWLEKELKNRAFRNKTIAGETDMKYDPKKDKVTRWANRFKSINNNVQFTGGLAELYQTGKLIADWVKEKKTFDLKDVVDAMESRGVKIALQDVIEARTWANTIYGLKVTDTIQLPTILGKVASQIAKEGIPAAQAAGIGIKEFTNIVKAVVAPRSGVAMDTLLAINRLKGARDWADTVMSNIGKSALEYFNTLSNEQLIKYLDDYRLGENIPAEGTTARAYYDTLKMIDDQAHSMGKSIKTDLNYLENHMRMFWKKRPSKVYESYFLGSSKLMGSKGYTKMRTYDLISHGIAAGGIPVSFNPMELQLLNYKDVLRNFTGKKLWDYAKDNGMVTFKPLTGAGANRVIDPTWKPINDKSVSEVWVKGEKGKTLVGTYYAEPGFKRLVDNYLSRDLIRDTAVGQWAMGIKQAYTSVELLGLFHAFFETQEANSSALGLGMRQISKGMWGEGAKNIASGGFQIAAKSYADLGGQAIRYLENKDAFLKTEQGKAFVKKYPQIEQLLQDLYAGGGKLSQSTTYAPLQKQAVLNAFKSNNYIEGTLRAVGITPQMLTHQLFGVYIPRLKVGAFLKEYSHELSVKRAGVPREQVAMEVWESIENRFGEMNFDNLYWDKTFKAGMQLWLRSATWKLGNARAFSNAIVGQLKEVRNAVIEGRKAEIHRDTAWVLGMSIQAAIAASLLQGFFGGKTLGQEEDGSFSFKTLMKDVVYPRVDPEDNDMRVTNMSYLRDVMSFTRDPWAYLKHSQAGFISKGQEALGNRTFYGVQVVDPEAPLLEQFFGKLVHTFKPMPFTITSRQRLTEAGEPDRVKNLALIGYTPASSVINDSVLDTVVKTRLESTRRAGARTVAENDLVQATKIFKDSIKNPDKAYTEEQLNDAKEILIDSGKLASKQFMNGIVKALGVPKKVALFNMVDVTTQAKALRAAYDAGDKKHYNEASPYFFLRYGRYAKDATPEKWPKIKAINEIMKVIQNDKQWNQPTK